MNEYTNQIYSNINNNTSVNNIIYEIMEYKMRIDLFCKVHIIDKLKFLQEYCSSFQNEIINLLLYCLEESNNLFDVVDINNYIIKMLKMNIMFMNVCNFMYDLVKLDINNADSTVNKLQKKINIQLNLIKSKKKKINELYGNKNYLLYKQMFNLEKQLIEAKITELETKRIKLYLNIKQNKFFFKKTNDDYKHMKKIINKSIKLMYKIEKMVFN